MATMNYSSLKFQPAVRTIPKHRVIFDPRVPALWIRGASSTNSPAIELLRAIPEARTKKSKQAVFFALPLSTNSHSFFYGLVVNQRALI
jgi:hypothetical protein